MWDKLREYQQVLSPHFPQHYAARTWKARKAELLRISRAGGLRLDVATHLETNKTIGYCVSTISRAGHAVLESIYVEPEYRRHGIGDALMRMALRWMDEKHATEKTLTVGVGNEEVLTFYARYGFYPKHIMVEQVEKDTLSLGRERVG